jgi:hypothetical protein
MSHFMVMYAGVQYGYGIRGMEAAFGEIALSWGDRNTHARYRVLVGRSRIPMLETFSQRYGSGSLANRFGFVSATRDHRIIFPFWLVSLVLAVLPVRSLWRNSGKIVRPRKSSATATD